MANPIRIPFARNLSPQQTANQGNVFPTISSLTAALPDFDLPHWQFLKDTTGSLFGYVSLPKTIGAIPAAKIVLIIFSLATTGVTRMRVQARPISSDAESLDKVLDTTIAAQDITVPATVNTTKEVTFTLPTTGNGFPVAAKDTLLVRIQHDGLDVNDTLAVDTKLLEAYLEVDTS